MKTTTKRLINMLAVVRLWHGITADGKYGRIVERRRRLRLAEIFSGYQDKSALRRDVETIATGFMKG